MTTGLAHGRASEVIDLGDGTVLRRFKDGGNPERETMVMRHAAAHGYPVPRVVDVRDDGLVLEKVAGGTMLKWALRRPWTMPRHAATLADLHERLHAIPAPAELPAAGARDGDRLLHLDLHPENVLLTRDGPVVIDWTNARRGEPALDVALTWVILATSGGPLGRLFCRLFVPHFDRAEVERAVPAAAELRLADPNVTEEERAAVRRFAKQREC
jgi:aminoglycoside phosphotransferase (APT) family kinase protein